MAGKYVDSFAGPLLHLCENKPRRLDKFLLCFEGLDLKNGLISITFEDYRFKDRRVVFHLATIGGGFGRVGDGLYFPAALFRSPSPRYRSVILLDEFSNSKADSARVDGEYEIDNEFVRLHCRVER